MSPQCPQDKIMSCTTLQDRNQLVFPALIFPFHTFLSIPSPLHSTLCGSIARHAPSHLLPLCILLTFTPVKFLPNPSYVSIQMTAIHPLGLNLSSKIYSMTSPKISTTTLNKIFQLLTHCPSHSKLSTQHNCRGTIYIAMEL